MPNQPNPKRVSTAVVFGLLLGTAAASSAATLNNNVQAESQINNNAQQSQERVTQLADQTDTLLTQYRQVVRETESLTTYNNQLEKVVNDQNADIQRIQNELEGLENTARNVVPLMLEMIDMLDRIVEADVPFRLDTRRRQVNRLRDIMDDSEITDSERFRQIMEAYQSELEFGRTTEAYDGQLPDGRVVDFLRVGRTLLLYQSKDGEQTGWWDSEAREFTELGDEYRIPVKEGLAIAGNRKAPDLVRLPVPAPEGES